MFLVNIESILLLALVKYILCSHFIKTVFCCTFWTQKYPYFVTKNCSKSSYICVFILSKKRLNWFHRNLRNSGMVEPRKLSDSSLNRIFNALSIGVQYTFSFQWTNFGLKCVFIEIAGYIDWSFLHRNFVLWNVSSSCDNFVIDTKLSTHD